MTSRMYFPKSTKATPLAVPIVRCFDAGSGSIDSHNACMMNGIDCFGVAVRTVYSGYMQAIGFGCH